MYSVYICKSLLTLKTSYFLEDLPVAGYIPTTRFARADFYFEFDLLLCRMNILAARTVVEKRKICTESKYVIFTGGISLHNSFRFNCGELLEFRLKIPTVRETSEIS